MIEEDQNAAESNHVTALNQQNIADDEDFSQSSGESGIYSNEEYYQENGNIYKL